MSANQVIVVGGGLAGLSAAHSVLEHGGTVALVDKSAFLGGNSTKATSGINGALTSTQIESGVKDSVRLFEEDTNKSFHGGRAGQPVSPLVRTLVRESAAAVDWLSGRFDLDLSILGLLGGHSQPRTHRGKERFPGMTMTYALMEALEKVQKAGPRARIITRAKVVQLLKDEKGSVIGCIYEKGDEQHKLYGPVIIATGGYAADFSTNSLLAQHRPDLLSFSTTNGEHCTGDGIRLAQEIGAALVDMKLVQVHPTGLVHPEEPNAKVKFLAAEALRGTGALMLNKHGQRFCNELGRRDYCSKQMIENFPPFRLVLNSAASKEIMWHCKHYSSRGLMKHYKNGSELAADMGIDPAALRATFEEYSQHANARSDPFGKTIFRNALFSMDDEFHVAIITPVVHYTMGGIAVNERAEVIDPNGHPISGLYAAGEVMGGVHGINRLGGNSLLDCVVYGRVAGFEVARYMLSVLFPMGGVSKRVEIISSHLPAGAIAQHTPAGQHRASRKITREEVAKHNKKNDLWVIVGKDVLDLTKFSPDHPGGARAILLYAGKDATEEFDMLHKREVIEKYAPECVIGTVV